MPLRLQNVTLLTPDAGIRFGVDVEVDGDGYIARIGPDLLHGRDAAAGEWKVHDAGGGRCLPGFVNAYDHSPLMIVRGMVEGEWLVRERRPTRIDWESVIADVQRVLEGLWARAAA